MKKTLLLPICLIFGATAFSQIENGGFEDWNKLLLFEQPFMDFTAMSSNYEIFMETGLTNVNKIDHEEGSAMRLETILAGEEVVPAFYLLGSTPESSGENLIFPGGVPASDPNVTGISVDMAYDFPGESSGFVIVQFKLDGIPVGPGTMGTGTFYFPLSGQQEWEDEIFDFGTSIGTNYDEVVIGFATADLIQSDSDFSIGPWIEIDNLKFVNSQDEIPNGDFETWTQVPAVFVPVKVDVEIDLLNPAIVKSEDASEGELALGLITREFDGYTNPTKAMLGTTETPDGIPTIDLNGEHSMLSFDYKYLAENDLAEVVITFYEESGESLIPVYGKIIELEPSSSYEEVQYAFLEDLDENFVSATKMSIEFYSSKEDGQPMPNSLLLIDDVEISGALGLIYKQVQTSFRIAAYPNPTLGRAVFNLSVPRTGFYRVYNNQGYQIDQVDFDNKKTVIYDLYDLPSGSYLFRFYHEGGIQMSRVLKI
jgi:hypothetical protein